MISVCPEHAGNVKLWRDGQMAFRWCAAGMVEAGKQFRRVNGHLHLPRLRAALEREFTEAAGPKEHDEKENAAQRCTSGCLVSSRGESHPPALAEPYVTVSRLCRIRHRREYAEARIMPS